MDLMNWNPFGQYGNVFDEDYKKLFRGLPVASNVIVPSVDIYVQNDDLVVEMPLPGIDPKNVDIEVDDKNVLTIKGKVEKKTEVDDKNYYRKETKVGSFLRNIPLPLNVEADQAKAEYNEGILKVLFPKKPESKAKRIEIETKK